jgi:[acyl-carrier-protein] S-malonyltransferase
MTVALLCSGQGAQHREMFRLTADLPAAFDLFSAAAKALGGDPREFVLTADDSALHANRAAQILCVTQGLAGAMLIAGALPRRVIVAGYSVGEVAAWGVAGLLSPLAAIDLSRFRAEIMDGASGADDGLGFVRGLPRASVAALAAQHEVEIAIFNPGDAFVVGGPRVALQAFREAAVAAGASRAGLLPVAVASHTSRMDRAVAPFRDAINKHDPTSPSRGWTLLSGLDGSTIFETDGGVASLASQLSAPVCWEVCLDAAVERGARLFLELGPGRALSEMAASAYPAIPARSIEDFHSAEGVREWLARLD